MRKKGDQIKLEKAEKIYLLALEKRRYQAYRIDVGELISLLFLFNLLYHCYFQPVKSSLSTWLIVELGLFVFGLPIFLGIFRDVFGRSFGKYIWRLKIVSTEGNKKPTLKQLILRNLLYLPYPDLITVPRDGIRFGDKIAKTKVIFEDADWEDQVPRWIKWIDFNKKVKGHF